MHAQTWADLVGISRRVRDSGRVQDWEHAAIWGAKGGGILRAELMDHHRRGFTKIKTELLSGSKEPGNRGIHTQGSQRGPKAQRFSNPAPENHTYVTAEGGQGTGPEQLCSCPSPPNGRGNTPPATGKRSECLLILKTQAWWKNENKKPRAAHLPSRSLNHPAASPRLLSRWCHPNRFQTATSPESPKRRLGSVPPGAAEPSLAHQRAQQSPRATET